MFLKKFVGFCVVLLCLGGCSFVNEASDDVRSESFVGKSVEVDSRRGDAAGGGGDEVFVVRNSVLSIGVSDVMGGVNDIRGFINENDGVEVVDYNYYRDVDVVNGINNSMASFKLRLSEEQKEALRGLVINSDTLVISDYENENNVTSRVLGLEAEIKSQEDSIERLSLLLDKASNVEEIIKVEEALGSRKASVARLIAENNSLRKDASKTSMTLTIRHNDSFQGNYWGDVKNGIVNVIKNIMIYVLPILVFAALVFLIIVLVKKIIRFFLRK